MKATNIKQSKKLAEILPIKTADMIYIMYCNGEKPQNGDANLSTVYESNDHKWYWIDIIDESWDMRIGEDIPCWSLGALLEVLPMPTLIQDKAEDELFWQCSVYNEEGEKLCETYASDKVDACYEMVVKLNELNLL